MASTSTDIRFSSRSSLPEDFDELEAVPQNPQKAHELGECRPCAYFWQKEDGCRQGDDCTFCHACDRDAHKRFKKQKRQRMRHNRHSSTGGSTAAGTLGRADEESAAADIDTEPVKVTLSTSFVMPPSPSVLQPRPYMPAHVYLKDPFPTYQRQRSDEHEYVENKLKLPEEKVPAVGRISLCDALNFQAPEDSLEADNTASNSGSQLPFEAMFPELGLRSYAPGHYLPRVPMAPPPSTPPSLSHFSGTLTNQSFASHA